jgi:hypothetical protein
MICAGTVEEKVYEKQVFKDGLRRTLAADKTTSDDGDGPSPRSAGGQSGGPGSGQGGGEWQGGPLTGGRQEAHR